MILQKLTMVDAATRKAVSSIPQLKTNAGKIQSQVFIIFLLYSYIWQSDDFTVPTVGNICTKLLNFLQSCDNFYRSHIIHIGHI